MKNRNRRTPCTRRAVLRPDSGPANKLSRQELDEAFAIAGLRTPMACKNNQGPFIAVDAPKVTPLRKKDVRETAKAPMPGQRPPLRVVRDTRGRFHFLRAPRITPEKQATE